MNISDLKKIILDDLARISPKVNISNSLYFLLKNPTFQIVFWFRVCNYLQNKKNCLSKFFFLFAKLIYRRLSFKTGIQLPIGTRVGPGLSFSHFSCIVINSSAIIGSNCTIFQGVTIGSKRGNYGGAPIIGDNVVITAGSKVIGHITIGNNVIIGANSVVVKSVSDFSVVAGNPGKVISYEGKRHTSLYLKNY